VPTAAVQAEKLFAGEARQGHHQRGATSLHSHVSTGRQRHATPRACGRSRAAMLAHSGELVCIRFPFLAVAVGGRRAQRSQVRSVRGPYACNPGVQDGEVALGRVRPTRLCSATAAATQAVTCASACSASTARPQAEQRAVGGDAESCDSAQGSCRRRFLARRASQRSGSGVRSKLAVARDSHLAASTVEVKAQRSKAPPSLKHGVPLLCILQRVRLKAGAQRLRNGGEVFEAAEEMRFVRSAVLRPLDLVGPSPRLRLTSCLCERDT